MGSTSRSGRSPPEEGMATHSSIPPWRIPWTEEPSRLQSTVSQRVRHDWCLSTHAPPREGDRHYRIFSVKKRDWYERITGRPVRSNPTTLFSVLIAHELSAAFWCNWLFALKHFLHIALRRSCPRGFPPSSLAIASPLLDPSSPPPSNAGGSQHSGLRPLLHLHSLPWGIYLISRFSIISVHWRLIHLFLQSEPIHGLQTYISNWCFSISPEMSNHRFKLIMSKSNSSSSFCQACPIVLFISGSGNSILPQTLCCLGLLSISYTPQLIHWQSQ